VTRRSVVLAVVVVLLAVTAGFAQRYIQLATDESFDGSFNFCRIAFNSASNGFGGGWGVDFPDADANLMTRLSELTRTPVSRIDGVGTPNHLVIRLTDPELFKCPFVMMTEVGGLFIFPEEAEALRAYLERGGFLWADDFWGENAWWVWESQIRKVLPAGPYPIEDLTPDHPLFRMMFNVREVTQIPSINHWRGTGGGTAETRDAQVPHARIISDDHDRIMVLITHNTDYGDSWEREAADPEYFQQFSVPGYAFGINAILYTMTH
jgi:hypothetical protein